MKGTLNLEKTVNEELNSVRKLRQEILEKAEDIEALEAVIETEGFQLDEVEKQKYADLRERTHARKLSSMNSSPNHFQADATPIESEEKDIAKIFVSNLEKNPTSDSHENKVTQSSVEGGPGPGLAPAYELEGGGAVNLLPPQQADSFLLPPKPKVLKPITKIESSNI